MSNVFPSLLSLIGETPLVEIKNIDTGLCKLFVKMESHNPGGSIKDRTALYIINQAERSGLLKPGGTIIEATAGNTGIGLALVGILKGYRVLLVIPDKMSLEKVTHLKALGAEVIFTRSDVGKDHSEYYHNIAEKLFKEIPGSFYADQFNNPANIMAHEETTGPEIWQQTDGKIDGFVCASGTGGTIGGVSSYLKEKNNNIKIYLSDPRGSALYNYIQNGELKSEGGSITEGIGSSRVTKNFATAKIDGAFSIDDKESLPIIFDLIKNEGLSLGTSSGVNIAGAIRLGKELGPGKTIVTILCDKSDKYNSKLFNKKFLQEKDLPYPNWL